MKFWLVNSLMALSLIFSPQLFAQEDPMKVGMSGQYFPFTFVEQDELKGFEIDIMNAVGKEMGREIIFQTAN
ncbi:MAG: putative amino-acid transport system substrate-binding protein, partial [Marinobacter psychrophilus]